MNLVAGRDNTDFQASDFEAFEVADWLAHFDAREAQNAQERLAFDERPLSDAEAEIVGRSIAQFQLGEVSDGAYLIKAMTDWAIRTGEDDLIPLGHKMVRASRHHAFLLAQFMDHHGLKRVKRHLLDAAFRVVRRLGGVETMLSTLMVAELMATHYYQCLGHSTRSVMLKRISEDLLNDEQSHIHLYRLLLGRLRAERSPFLFALTNWIEKTVFFFALLAVWPFHHKVYRRAGTSFGIYWAVYWRRYGQAVNGLGQARTAK